VRFEGHPNLQRILLPEGWKGTRCAGIFPVHGHKYSLSGRVGAASQWRRTPGTRHEAIWKPTEGAVEPEHESRPGDDARMVLNMGPQHPSTHGVLRIILELDGEIIRRAEPDIGFLHTGIEKQAEALNWQQVVTLTTAWTTCQPWKQSGLRPAGGKAAADRDPAHAQWMRVMLTELSRISSHLVWLGTPCLDLGR